MERITDIGTLLSCFQETGAKLGFCDHVGWRSISLSWARTTRLSWRRRAAVSIGLVIRWRSLLAHATGADRVEATGATCYILDPMRFRIITDSWNKTDRQDARNMAKALWVFLVTGKFGIPTV
jgi:hypothetical protein